MYMANPYPVSQRSINRLNLISDIVVYTDGSACPNPGRIGSRVFVQCGNIRNTYEEAIGVGSNITAEPFAIRSAMEKLKVMDKRDFSRVLILSSATVNVQLIYRLVEHQ